jgi:hypothetical protein
MLKSTSVSLNPLSTLSTWPTVTSAFNAACASFWIRSRPVRAATLPSLSAMALIIQRGHAVGTEAAPVRV